MVFDELAYGRRYVSCIAGDDTCCRQCFLRTLQKNNNCFCEFRDDRRQWNHDNNEEETESDRTEYVHTAMGK